MKAVKTGFWTVAGLIVAGLSQGLLEKHAPEIWAWIADCFRATGSHLIAASGWPNWLVYLLTLIALAAAFTIIVLVVKEARELTYISYCEDDIDGVRWRWSYPNGRLGTPVPYCRSCDTMLVAHTGGNAWAGNEYTKLFCERCHAVRLSSSGDPDSLRGRIEREIARRIRAGDWRPAGDTDSA